MSRDSPKPLAPSPYFNGGMMTGQMPSATRRTPVESIRLPHQLYTSSLNSHSHSAPLIATGPSSGPFASPLAVQMHPQSVMALKPQPQMNLGPDSISQPYAALLPSFSGGGGNTSSTSKSMLFGIPRDCPRPTNTAATNIPDLIENISIIDQPEESTLCGACPSAEYSMYFQQPQQPPQLAPSSLSLPTPLPPHPVPSPTAHIQRTSNHYYPAQTAPLPLQHPPSVALPLVNNNNNTRTSSFPKPQLPSAAISPKPSSGEFLDRPSVPPAQPHPVANSTQLVMATPASSWSLAENSNLPKHRSPPSYKMANNPLDKIELSIYSRGLAEKYIKDINNITFLNGTR